MRVPVPSSPQPNPKPSNNIVRTIALPNTGLCYEPTSVLDLCRSPSPTEKPTGSQECLDLDEHAVHNLDWDSIMMDLGLHDESGTPVLKTFLNPSCDDFTPLDHALQFTTLSDIIYSNQNQNQNLPYNYNTTLDHDFNTQSHHHINGFDFIEDLIRAADCFDTKQLHVAQEILERLNQRLRSPAGKPLQRAAFYFREALHSLLSGSNRTPTLSSMVEIIHTIKTFKAFSGISPIPMFSIFTTNQVLLDHAASSFMHVIDFDIGLGIQYASLIKEIADKALDSPSPSPLLRITAVVPEEFAVESTLVRDNLAQFALELRIRVQLEFVPMRTFETLSFTAVKFVDGEKTAVLLTPVIFRHLGNAAAFLADVRRVSPSVVVFVDGEGWAEAATAAVTSFRRGVVSSLEYYSMMLESLDASTMGGGGEWVRRIEMMLVRPKILAAVESVWRRMPPWREAFYGAGMRAVQLSQFADFQAECLLAKSQIRGFHVAKRQNELVLFWHDRAMVATSAWRC